MYARYKMPVKRAGRDNERVELENMGIYLPNYDGTSKRRNVAYTGKLGAFIEPEDIVPVQLLYSLQKKRPLRNLAGFTIQDLVLSDEVMVWQSETEAIICFVGQNVVKNVQHFIDDLTIAGVTSNQSCQLRLARVGEEIIKTVGEKGLKITLVGFSLGGATAACLAGMEQVSRGILLNPGAPVTNEPRETPENFNCYHIVGDIVSTHFTRCKRIYLLETAFRINQTEKTLQTDGIQWDDVAYYHDMDRFLDFGSPFDIVSAQFEQNSIENYFFFKKGNLFDVVASIAGVLSVEFNFRKKFQNMICANPIPGSQPSRGCNEGGPGLVDTIIGGTLGGAAGAAASIFGTGGTALVPATTGGAKIGADLATGEKGILDLVAPDLVKKAVDVKDFFVQGSSKLDSLNKNKGVYTSTIVDSTPEKFVQKRKFEEDEETPLVRGNRNSFRNKLLQRI